MMGISPFSVILLLLLFLERNHCCSSVDKERNQNCGSFVHSSCEDSLSVEWNKKNIGMELKSWIKSIKKLTSEEIQNNAHSTSRKGIWEAKGWDNSTIIRGISNLDCVAKKTVGVSWQSAGTSSKDQFHDGFLYGIKNEKGSMTGLALNNQYFLIVLKQLQIHCPCGVKP